MMRVTARGPEVAWVDGATLRELSQVHTTRWLLAVAGDWLLIAACAAISVSYPHWVVYLGAILVIGTRQHALGVLMHEGVHLRVARSRFWNDLLSDWLAGYPVFAPTAGYRAFHLEHHRLLDTPADPERITVDRFPREWSYPMARWRLLWILLRDATGIWPRPLLVLAALTWRIPGQWRRHALGVLMLHGSAIVGAALGGVLHLYLLLWLVPLATVFAACFRLRTAAEHSGLDGPGGTRYRRSEVDVLATTRSTVARTLLGRVFSGVLMPHGICYHVEHHLYPSVPFDRLPALSRLLQSRSEFARRLHLTSGYSELVRELTRRAADRRPAVDPDPAGL